jgi:hypothetical protein
MPRCCVVNVAELWLLPTLVPSPVPSPVPRSGVVYEEYTPEQQDALKREVLAYLRDDGPLTDTPAIEIDSVRKMVEILKQVSLPVVSLCVVACSCVLSLRCSARCVCPCSCACGSVWCAVRCELCLSRPCCFFRALLWC